MIEWHIQPRSHACQSCGHGFRADEIVHTLLFDERQSYHRLDICGTCWTNQFSDGANHRKGFVSHWQSHYEPPTPACEPIQKETAETLLRKLLDRNDPRYATTCFILAVMLERKRLLKIKAQSHEGGKRVFIYEHNKSGDIFAIRDPDLQLDQLESVQRDVSQLLERGLEPTDVPGQSQGTSGDSVLGKQVSETNTSIAEVHSGP